MSVGRRRPWASFGLALALLVSLPAGLCARQATPETPGAPLARLVSPAAGSALVPGTVATIAWEPQAGLAALSHVEEWEAFLSLDGGATYPLRITPHLDANLRSFFWRVPNLPTASARLLLRFGDERREVGMEVPGAFTIAAIAAGRATHLPWGALPARVIGRGERARPDGPGVVSWVEGPRDGSRWRAVEGSGSPRGLRGAQGSRGFALLLAGSAPERTALLLPPLASASEADDIHRSAVPAPAAPRAAPPVRLLIHRFNE
jgi:hypothetical protein